MGQHRKMGSYKDLLVWQKGIALVKDIYSASASFPSAEAFGLTSQIRRAAVSVPSNIAEGNGRASRAEYLHFLNIANGSCNELETQLIIASELGFLDAMQTHALLQQTNEVGRMLNKLISRLTAPSEY